MATEQWADRTTESFQGLLLRHRGRTGLTQRQLAAQVGVSRGSIQDWEAGLNYPDAQHLQALIVAFLEAGGLTRGSEASEAETLWAAALRQAPRMQTPFDAAWWRGVLGPRPDDSLADRAPQRIAENSGNTAVGNTERRQDWGEAPSVIGFLGRVEELSALRQWVLVDRSRVVAVLGIGGIGKTTLAARLAQDVAPMFQRVFWRSMRDALPLGDYLASAIAFVSDNQLVPPESEAAKRGALLQLLAEWPSLLVLDNFETLLEPGRADGRYRDGYAGYGRLLQALGEGRHRSCLLVTSREAPPELVLIPGGAVRTMYLGGLGLREAQGLLADKQLMGTAENWMRLVDRFGGNGLALKIVGESIREVFGGDIGGFLQASASGALAGGIRRLLGGQLQRGSELEQCILRVLAVAREPLTVVGLITTLGPHAGRGAVLEAIEGLRRRSLVEYAEVEGAAGFTLQSVVLEYVTDSLVEEVSHEIIDARPCKLGNHPLIHAQANDYVRQTQELLIGEPILQRLKTQTGGGAVEQRLMSLLDSWRSRPLPEHGFGPGNIVNLLRLLRGDLRGQKLGGLEIRQAYLASVEAQDASLAGSQLVESVLAEAFTHPMSVALSGDAESVAAGTSTGQVYLWRVADRARLLAVEAHSGPVHGLAISSNGRLLVSGGDDGMLRLWDAHTGAPLMTLHAHSGPVYDVALSPDSDLLASGGEDRIVRFWDVRSGQLLFAGEGHAGPVYGVALSANRQLSASGSEDGSVRLWSPASGRPLGTLLSHAGPTYGVALSADGRLLATAGLDGMVRLWSTSDVGQLLGTVEGHTSGVWRVALSPDGKLLAYGGWDGTVRLWEVPSVTARPRPAATLQSSAGGVYGVALSANKRLVANGSEDGTIRIWDATGGRLLVTLQGDTSAIRSLALTLDSSTLCSGGFDGTLRFWDLSRDRLGGVVRAHAGAVHGVAFSADRRLVASAGLDGAIRLWSVADTGIEDAPSEPLATLEGHTGAVYSVALAFGGRLVASGGLDRTVRLWDAATGQLHATLEGHTRPVWVVALTRPGGLLASGSLDGTVRLWDVTTGRLLHTLEHHTGAVYSLAFSADGRLLASGSQDGTVGLWDMPDGRFRAALRGHTGAVFGVTLDAEARLLASGGLDGTVRTWDVTSGASVAVLNGHTGPVYSVAINPDGLRLASAGLDGTIRLWDTVAGTAVGSLRSDRRYERLDISGLTGVTGAQRAALLALGAVDSQADQPHAVVGATGAGSVSRSGSGEPLPGRR